MKTLLTTPWCKRYVPEDLKSGDPTKSVCVVPMTLVQLRWCAKHGYILITHNVSDFWRHHRDFLSRGERHAGLVLVPQQSLSIGERLRRLIKLAGIRSTEQMQNRAEFLSAWG